MPVKRNLPLLMDRIWAGYNRGLPKPNGDPGEWEPVRDKNGMIVTTFCNLFVRSVATGLGYDGYATLQANGMVRLMKYPQHGWIRVDERVAQEHANTGVLVVAGWENLTGHGHVCIILPGKLEYSASYGKDVPKCVNVGERNFIGLRVSLAFAAAKAPQYYALTEMI